MAEEERPAGRGEARIPQVLEVEINQGVVSDGTALRMNRDVAGPQVGEANVLAVASNRPRSLRLIITRPSC